MRRPVSLHALYVTLGERDLFEASLASVYDAVERVTVLTTHDRDWRGEPRDGDGLAEAILSRRLDPDRKVELIVTGETNEARARNRAMDFAAPRRSSLRVRAQHDRDGDLRPADYFLIVDADEIWARDSIEALRDWASRDRLPAYHAACVRYFRDWTTRIGGLEWAPVLQRRDVRATQLRRWTPPRWRRGVVKYAPFLPARSRDRLRRIGMVPAEVAVFHHGSYVGPRERVAAKLASFGHAHEVADGWLERVWDLEPDELVDFHPVWPKLFPDARRVAPAELPAEIAAWPWPAGYLAA